jgi:hypothetical protein
MISFKLKQTIKSNKETFATIARKSWQSSNDEDDVPIQQYNGTISHQL